MSPATKSKSKDKKAMKEPPKGTLKASGHVNTSGGVPASGYNPLLGTFHTIETAPVPSTSPHHGNGRFRNIDDSDDHTGSSFGTGIEYDSVSNNDSWSGESEDQKDKTSQSLLRQESVPGADNDKREKIRQKNEKKHQRQKEKRAQELHERCSGYLMSRKLEALALQLVGMGFSQERATMALILNEGRVEDSVACLCEGTEDDDNGGNNLDGGGNLKIDISDELARIADLEIRYKSSKQEVERVIVACEGDLDSAEETLKSQKHEPPAAPPKLEENIDPPTVGNGKQQMPVTQIAIRAQAKPSMSSSTIIQHKRDEKDFNYTKAPVTVTGSSSSQDNNPGIKNMQVLQRIPSNKPDWAKQQQIDKRRVVAGSNNPSVSYSMPSPLQTAPPPAKPESARFVPELKNLQLGSLREPVIVMQRSQSINLPKQQIPPTPSSSVVTSANPSSMGMNWYPNHNIEPMKQPPVTIPRSDVNVSSYPMYNQFHPNQSQQFMPNNSSSMDTNRGSNNGMWSRGVVSPTLAPASSLGLFSGPGGSPGASSPVDWSTGGSMLQMDYASIDWSLDLGSLTSRPNGMWNGSNYTMQNNGHGYDSLYGLGMRSSSTRPVMSNGNGSGLQSSSTEQTGGGSRDWTSPFEEKDLFSLPRQFVSSPSL